MIIVFEKLRVKMRPTSWTSHKNQIGIPIRSQFQSVITRNGFAFDSKGNRELYKKQDS